MTAAYERADVDTGTVDELIWGRMRVAAICAEGLEGRVIHCKSRIARSWSAERVGGGTCAGDDGESREDPMCRKGR